MKDPIELLAGALMRRIVASGVIRGGEHQDHDIDVACRVMRAELKAFLSEDCYADERAMVLAGGPSSLAFASLVATCAAAIVAGREPAAVDAERREQARRLGCLIGP